MTAFSAYASFATGCLGLLAGCTSSGAVSLPPNAADGARRFRIQHARPAGDHDGDGVDDAGDACPDALEEWNGDRDADGCPEGGRGLVRFDLETGEIDVLDPFALQVMRDPWFHETERRDVLQQIAFFLVAHPELGVEIREEHVEDVCPARSTLHEAQFLIEARGVDPRRIRAEDRMFDPHCARERSRPHPGGATDVVSRLEVRLLLPRRR